MSLRATFWDYTPADLERFIDARVRLRGNVGTLFGRTEQLRGVSLFVGRTSDVEVLESPPDPFSLPARTIESIYNYSPAGEVNRRIRVRGVVTGYIPGHPVELSDFTSTARFRFVRHVLYVDDGTGGARVETEQPQRVAPGTVVEVVGFPGRHAGQADSDERDLSSRRAGGRSRAAIAVDGDNVLTPENDATLVRMEGHLLSMLRSPRERILVLEGRRDRVRRQPRGQRRRHASARADPAREHGRGHRRVFLSMGTAADRSVSSSARPTTCRVVAAAPWWTLQHTAVMVVMLALVAGGRRRLGADDRASASGSSIRRCSTSAAASDASCTTRSSRASPASRFSSRRSPAAWRRRRRRRGNRSMSRRQMLRYSQEEARRSVMDLRSQALESGDLAGGADGPGAADDAAARARWPTCGSRARRSGWTRRRSTTCCGSVSRR